MTQRYDISFLCQPRDILGESPVWDSARDLLYWVDIRRSLLHVFSTAANTHDERTLGPELLTGVVLAQPDALVIGRPHALEHIGTGVDTFASPLVDFSFLPTVNRTNEIKTDPRGRIWTGAMWDYARGCSGGLYRVEVNGQPTCVRQNVRVPNSLAFSPDGKWMYFADTATGAIERAPYDEETGAVGTWHELIGASTAPGKPDGLAIDTQGCLWSARFGAGQIVRFTPDGRIDRTIDLPVTRPTSCAFGGADMQTLFVTTATQGLSVDQQVNEPLAGALLAVATQTTGLAVGRAVLPGSIST
ncbi:hypothetical protein WL93_18050 [Burkholderia diffusa]|uniref:SMP-30/gluconolactonase/LRE family protein n=1 Tax=Burkholderia diffusa TaxID=488732 RepID=UPI0007586D4F|nr:SMP-30/gluconolactonase/LRE family protein [Burkholderia diffusa]KWF86759.1 hypothetical protein WL93_18050 [Burkholderia diffusa]